KINVVFLGKSSDSAWSGRHPAGTAYLRNGAGEQSERGGCRMSARTGIALALMLAAQPALACTGQSVHLDGEFKTGELGWGHTDEQFQAKGREAVLTPQPGTQIARWDTAVTLTDLDVCVTLTLPASTADAARTYAGLLFWLTDKDNFYEAV